MAARARTQQGSRPIRLVDGSRLLVRPICAADSDGLLEAFRRLSPESRYRRFLSAAATLDRKMLAYFTDVDHHSHEALVAVDPSDGTIAGVARFIAMPDEPGVAEMAIEVVDSWQGRGLGTALLALLIDRAWEEDVHAFNAITLAHNRPMLEVLDEFGVPVRRGGDGATADLLLELPRAGLGERLPSLLEAAAHHDLHLGRDEEPATPQATTCGADVAGRQ